jgi:hypothetical protein
LRLQAQCYGYEEKSDNDDGEKEGERSEDERELLSATVPNIYQQRVM